MDTRDVAIIGAGPSGAWTAHLLARAGARVVLFDPSHPREKPCGGGVTGRALDVVSAALASGDVPAVRIRTARFVEAGHLDATVPLSGDALVVASRSAFDGRLLTAARDAGAQLAPARVRRIETCATGFRIETAEGAVHHAARVVGADGANSLVRKTLGTPFRRDQLSIATGFFAHGVTSDEIVIELMSDPPGYFWSFPRPGHLAIGICAQADAGATAGALRHRAAEWIQRTRLAPHARLEPYSWPIPSLSARDFATQQVAGRGWLLIGDAAGLVDPITREGIFFALESARFAAEALLSESATACLDYAERVRREIAADLARGARLKAAFFRPRFTRLMVSALAESAPIRAVMADLVAGTQSYRTLKWRLAATREVGLAWRLLRT